VRAADGGAVIDLALLAGSMVMGVPGHGGLRDAGTGARAWLVVIKVLAVGWVMGDGSGSRSSACVVPRGMRAGAAAWSWPHRCGSRCWCWPGP
jgi:hypothetical protein